MSHKIQKKNAGKLRNINMSADFREIIKKSKSGKQVKMAQSQDAREYAKPKC